MGKHIGLRLTEPQRLLVNDHLWLVELHLRRKVPNLAVVSAGRSWEDLYQEGCLGLIEAARRYDPHCGIPFVAYALPRIHTPVSRALWGRGSMLRLPRRVQHAGSRSKANVPACAPQVVPLEHEPTTRDSRAPEHAVDRETGETVGDRMWARIQRAVMRAVEIESRGRSRRHDRRALLELLASRRLLVAEEEHRTPMRELARQTRSSVARVVQAEHRIRERTRELLNADMEVQRLQKVARRHPLGIDAPIDGPLHVELRALAEGRYMDTFERASAEQRGRLVVRLVECSGRRVADLVRDLFSSLPREQQDVLLTETRLAG